MLTQNPGEPAASSSPDAPNGTPAPVDFLDPRAPIEVASTGPGTVNDPAGKDTKPPTVSEAAADPAA
jgi:hypothetical protein